MTTLHFSIILDKLKYLKDWPDKADYFHIHSGIRVFESYEYEAACERAKANAIDVTPESVDEVTDIVLEQADEDDLISIEDDTLWALTPETVYAVNVAGKMEEQPTHTCKFDFGRDNCPKDLDECRVNCAYNKVAVYVPDSPHVSDAKDKPLALKAGDEMITDEHKSMKELTPQILHFYIGSSVLVKTKDRPDGFVGKLLFVYEDVWDGSHIIDTANVLIGNSKFSYLLSDCTLLLRRLSDMTEEEAVTCFINKFPEPEYHARFSNVRVGPPDRGIGNARPVTFDFMSDKLGRTYSNVGTLSFVSYSPNQFLYLLSKSFDLFGLIDDGLALDAKTLDK